MNIQTKILTPILLLLIILTTIFSAGLLHLNRVKLDMEQAIKNNKILLDYTNRMSVHRQEARLATLLYRISPQPEYLESINHNTEHITKLTALLKPLVTSATGTELMQEFESYRGGFTQSRDDLIAAIQQGSPLLIEEKFRIWQIKADNSRAALEDFISFNQNTLSRSLTVYGNLVSQIFITQIILLLVVVAVVILFYFYLSRIITLPLQRLTRTAQAISENRYTVKNQVYSQDELGILTENLDSMSVKLKAYNQSMKDKVKLKELQLKQIKELEAQKDEFIEIASHELKTPITTIKAYAQFMKSTFIKEGNYKSAEYMQKMERQIARLVYLISDLLDVTKIQAGKLQLRFTEFDFNEMVQEVADELQLMLTQHTIKLELQDTTLVSGDREKIAQVVTNFITNASKYSPEGSTIIVLTKKLNRTVQFCVQDNGIGIPKDQQAKIFERFYQVQGQTKGNHPGLGLGLYICSEIIRRHHGKIWVRSTQGKGSRFYFSLPIKTKALQPRLRQKELTNYVS